MDQKINTWICPKCNEKISNAIDMDYHYNTIHPNWDNDYVRVWHKNGCPGLSPYD